MSSPWPFTQWGIEMGRNRGSKPNNREEDDQVHLEEHYLHI